MRMTLNHERVEIAARLRSLANEHDQQTIPMLSYDADFMREVADRIDSAANHETGIEQRGFADFNSHAICSCGWVGPWRKTLWTERRVNRDANRHSRRQRRATIRNSSTESES